MRSENWARYRIGDSESVPSFLMRIRSELANLENASRVQWTGRRVWGTHTYSGGCWICDGFGVIHGLLALLEEGYPQEGRRVDKESNSVESTLQEQNQQDSNL